MLVTSRYSLWNLHVQGNACLLRVCSNLGANFTSWALQQAAEPCRPIALCCVICRAELSCRKLLLKLQLSKLAAGPSVADT